jgi:hypothetical protein
MATKRRKSRHSSLGEVQNDLDNYGTAASQRPQREKKRPARFINSPTPSKKQKTRHKQDRNSKPKQNTSRSKARSKARSQPSMQQTNPMVSDSQPEIDPPCSTVKAVHTVEKSRIVHLKISPPKMEGDTQYCLPTGLYAEVRQENPNVTQPETQQAQESRSDPLQDHHSESDPDNQSSLQSSNRGVDQQYGYDQFAQPVPVPVPASSQVTFSISRSQDDFNTGQSHENEASAPRTPESNPTPSSRILLHEELATPNRVPSQDSQYFAPSTPESLPHQMTRGPFKLVTEDSKFNDLFATPVHEDTQGTQTCSPPRGKVLNCISCCRSNRLQATCP